ncbi:MAG TPA: hypothetical protein VHW72_18465 [Candidatus Angelobacter sp.]|nr:hypothetical protein [Candidatus Angelobacter sp.]
MNRVLPIPHRYRYIPFYVVVRPDSTQWIYQLELVWAACESGIIHKGEFHSSSFEVANVDQNVSFTR